MPTSGRPSFEIPAQVLYRQVEKEVVLLNVETEQYFALNEVGANILRHLIEEPMDEAIDALLALYEVEPDVLHRDVQNLVDALVQARLLQRIGSSTHG
ncbi:MAG: PqqD family protein [Actinomycetota bacterium]|nr:PqqD family protein [Actinomycetota bacterium]